MKFHLLVLYIQFLLLGLPSLAATLNQEDHFRQFALGASVIEKKEDILNTICLDLSDTKAIQEIAISEQGALKASSAYANSYISDYFDFQFSFDMKTAAWGGAFRIHLKDVEIINNSIAVIKAEYTLRTKSRKIVKKKIRQDLLHLSTYEFAQYCGDHYIQSIVYGYHFQVEMMFELSEEMKSKYYQLGAGISFNALQFRRDFVLENLRERNNLNVRIKYKLQGGNGLQSYKYVDSASLKRQVECLSGKNQECFNVFDDSLIMLSHPSVLKEDYIVPLKAYTQQYGPANSDSDIVQDEYAKKVMEAFNSEVSAYAKLSSRISDYEGQAKLKSIRDFQSAFFELLTSSCRLDPFQCYENIFSSSAKYLPAFSVALKHYEENPLSFTGYCHLQTKREAVSKTIQYLKNRLEIPPWFSCEEVAKIVEQQREINLDHRAGEEKIENIDFVFFLSKLRSVSFIGHSIHEVSLALNSTDSLIIDQSLDVVIGSEDESKKACPPNNDHCVVRDLRIDLTNNPMTEEMKTILHKKYVGLKIISNTIDASLFFPYRLKLHGERAVKVVDLKSYVCFIQGSHLNCYKKMEGTRFYENALTSIAIPDFHELKEVTSTGNEIYLAFSKAHKSIIKKINLPGRDILDVGEIEDSFVKIEIVDSLFGKFLFSHSNKVSNIYMEKGPSLLPLSIDFALGFDYSLHLLNSGDEILISGGFVNGKISDAIYKLNLAALTSIKLTNLLIPLAGHKTFEIEGRIMFLGGINQDLHPNKNVFALVNASRGEDRNHYFVYKLKRELSHSYYRENAYLHKNGVSYFSINKVNSLYPDSVSPSCMIDVFEPRIDDTCLDGELMPVGEKKSFTTIFFAKDGFDFHEVINPFEGLNSFDISSVLVHEPSADDNALKILIKPGAESGSFLSLGMQ